MMAELAERDSYSFELQGGLLDAEELRSNAAADVANLRTDISRLFPEMLWAERYRDGVFEMRSNLESEVREAEASLLERRRDLRAADGACTLAGSDLLKEERAEQASEAVEA